MPSHEKISSKTQAEVAGSKEREIKELLLEATFKPGRAVTDDVASIRIDQQLANGLSFSDMCQGLVDASLRDVNGNEYYRVVKAAIERRMLIGSQKKGNKFSVDERVQLKIDQYGIQREFVMCVLHSHRYDLLPISPQDCVGLMMPDTEVDRTTLVQASTVLQNMFLFRTDKSPVYKPEELRAYINKWNQDVMVKSATAAPAFRDLLTLVKLKGVEKLEKIVAARVQIEILWKKIIENNWMLFVGSLESSTIKRASSLNEILL